MGLKTPKPRPFACKLILNKLPSFVFAAVLFACAIKFILVLFVIICYHRKKRDIMTNFCVFLWGADLECKPQHLQCKTSGTINGNTIKRSEILECQTRIIWFLNALCCGAVGL